MVLIVGEKRGGSKISGGGEYRQNFNGLDVMEWVVNEVYEWLFIVNIK